mmetsp:Transcript_23648/g.93774  ORF Transcript_23648/g.93774 Transcript_23648/m.93774 type:complete len:203 (-) Transcript_23648:20-628(-)
MSGLRPRSLSSSNKRVAGAIWQSAAHAEMAAEYEIKFGSTVGCCRISSSNSNAFFHWRPFSQAEMAELYVIASGSTPRSRMRAMTDNASSQRPALAHAAMAAEYVMRFGATPYCPIIRSSTSSASCQRPCRLHAETTAVQSLTSGARKSVGAASSTTKPDGLAGASPYESPRALAEAAHISSSRRMAASHLPAFSQAKMAIV